MIDLAHLVGRILEVWVAMILLTLPAAIWIGRRLARLQAYQPGRSMGAELDVRLTTGRWPDPPPSPGTPRGTHKQRRMVR